MERFLETLPRPVLVLGAIILGVGLVIFLKPPHSICDTQREQAEALLPGLTKSIKMKEKTHPPRISAALENCYHGRSTGACYDYFQILKTLAKAVKGATSECRAEVFSLQDIKTRLEEGVKNLALLAWGDFPPPAGSIERFGTLQESEIALFCYLKSVVIEGKGEAGWHELRRSISKVLPGEKVNLPTDPKAALVTPRAASEVFSENEIWNRSLFSVRCENYL